MTIHAQREVVDRWLADGRWVQFAPGRYSDDLRTRTRQMMQRHGIPEGTDICDECEGRGWLVDYPKTATRDVCWKCHGVGRTQPRLSVITDAPLRPPADWGGVQRLAVTVPHVHTRRCRGLDCLPNRITVAWATIEWVGPIVAYHLSINAIAQFEMADGVRRDLPLGIDPQSLVGQWARGGTIEVAG